MAFFAPAIPPILTALGEAIAAAAPWIVGGTVVVGGAAVVADQMSKAEEEAKAKDKAGTTTDDCATCKNPCAHLACGAPGSKYRGGAHGCMTGTPSTKGDGLDSHHMPADSVSSLNREAGPAIQMDPRDHRMTNSYGRSPATNGTLAAQRQMITSGNFIAAQAIDVAEVMAKFPGKYDAAIAQMEAYTACLKKNGLI
ncbi:MAG: hypothetical protein IPL47_03255 [Phyllobacteriaceae bacterium]|nr:hypothetical protein [Phyllobacteriaceae bacterium]